MFPHSLSSSFSLPQPFVKEGVSDRHHSRESSIESDNHHRRNHRIAEDSYQPTTLNDATGSVPIRSNMAVEAVATDIKQSIGIQVTTKEGDVVTVNLSNETSTKSGALEIEQQSDRLRAYAQDNNYESNFDFTVEGDLNKDELKSLAKLIHKMDRVSNQFFNGNVNAAFRHAQKIGLDTEQLAGFSMDLNMEKSVKAVSAYQQTLMPERTVNSDMVKQASDFLADTQSFMDDTTELLASFSEPQQAYTDLFAGVSQVNKQNQLQLVESSASSLFLDIVENIAKGVFAAS